MRLLALLLLLAAWPAAAHKPSDSYLALTVDGSDGRRPMGHRAARPRFRDRPRRERRRRDHLGRGARAPRRHRRLCARRGLRCAPTASPAPRAPSSNWSTITPTAPTRCCVSLATCPEPVTALDVDYSLLFDLDPAAPRPAAPRAWRRHAHRDLRPGARRQSFELASATALAAVPATTRAKASGTSGSASTTFCSCCRCCCRRCCTRKDDRWQAVERFAPAFWDVFKIVTAFTVAHSITLSLATLGVDLAALALGRIGDRAVGRARRAEQSLSRSFRGRRWMVAFALRADPRLRLRERAGRPRPAAGRAAAGAGRLQPRRRSRASWRSSPRSCPLAFLLRRTAFYRRAVLVGGSALIVLVAGVWLVERAADVKVITARVGGFG